MRTSDASLGGTRVLVAALVVGDYVRFGGHRLNPHLTDEWWKVTAISTDRDPRLSLVNRDGRTITVTAYTSIKIFRHRHSQRQAEARLAGTP